MSELAARQLNNYIRLPYDLLAMLPHGQAYVLGDVYSFTGDNLDCYRTYKRFGERAGSSRATVGRALRTGKAQGLISIDKTKGYIFDRDKVNGKEFMRVPEWIMTEEFDVRKNKRRKLHSSERSVYGYIFTHCDNGKKRDKACEASIPEIAKAVRLSERTVHRARWVLIRAELIYCPKEDKGVNAYKKSRYTLNWKLIREHGKKAKAENKAATAIIELQQPKTVHNVEQYYKDKRYRAELAAERNLTRAREYSRFKIADDTYKSISISAVFAAYNNSARAAELEQRAARAKAERLIALREIGLTEADIEPQYECRLCNDTGQLENGVRCKCYPRGEPPTNGENVGAGELNK